MKTKLEYIWLDGYFPTQNMRSKTKVVENFGGKLEDCPMWSFDGSSTKQAEGGSSDCLLKPVAIAPWVFELAFMAVTSAAAVLFPDVKSEVRVAASAF